MCFACDENETSRETLFFFIAPRSLLPAPLQGYCVCVCDILQQVPGSIQEQCTLADGARGRSEIDACRRDPNRQIRIQIAASHIDLQRDFCSQCGIFS